MASIPTLLSSIGQGYGRLFFGLLRVAAAALLIAGLAALIALPLWALAIHASGLYTVLLGGGTLLWLILRGILRLRQAGRSPAGRKEITRKAGTIFIRILHVALILYLGQFSAVAFLQGFHGTGSILGVIDLLLLGLLIRTRKET